MKTKIKFMLVALMATVIFSSCERVAPNYAGVLMENYGKKGKDDFKIVSGKVSTWEWGTELFQVPLFEQMIGTTCNKHCNKSRSSFKSFILQK